MTYNPYQLDLFIDPLLNIYMEIENEMIFSIVKRLDMPDTINNKNILNWQLEKLNSLGMLNRENIKIISKKSGKSLAEIYKAIKDAGMMSAQTYDNQLQQAFNNGVDFTLPPRLKDDRQMLDVLKAYQSQASDVLNLVNTTLIDQSQQVYLDIINTTVAKVSVGMKTPQQALAETAGKWAEQGIPALVDKSGRKWSTEAYVFMVGQSTVKNVANEMQTQRSQEWGCDLIEVSSHIGARPLCAPFQGKIYSMSGKSRKYPPFSSTSYGKPAGLFGINCHHVKYPYWEGKSRQTYQQYDTEQNRIVYEQSQQQRAIEREIRRKKRKLKAIEKIGDPEAIQSAKKQVRAAQAKMREFISETERTRHYDREKLY